jgi:preprotein translocase subunit YajC
VKRDMPGLIEGLPFLLAQAAGGGGADGAAPGGGLPAFLMMVLPLFVVFYLMVYLPGQREDKARKAAIAKLKKNDRVLTSAGIYGTVSSIDPDQDRMVIRSGDTRLDVTRSSIVRVLQDPADKTVESGGS